MRTLPKKLKNLPGIERVINESKQHAALLSKRGNMAEFVLKYKKEYDIDKFVRKICGMKLYPEQEKALVDFYNNESEYEDLVLVWGRKSGKTMVASLILLYEVYNLMIMDDPHTHYGMLPGQDIYALLVSVDQQQALNVGLNYVKTIAKHSWYFSKLIKGETSHEINFEKNITLRAQSSSSRSSRGYPCIAILFDELAWFLDTGGNSSGEAVYKALKPNIKVFKGDGKAISISSPAGKSGMFWDLYETGQKKGNKIVVFQGATWEINPTITYEDLKHEFEKDPEGANREYGAVFSDVVDAYFNKEKIRKAEKINMITEIDSDDRQRVVALDPGLKHDRYAVVMGYKDKERDKIVIDYVKVFQGTKKNPVQISDVENLMEQLNENFNVKAWCMDQHQSAATIQKYEKKKWNIKETYFSMKYNQSIFSNLNALINMEKIALPQHKLTIKELHFMQRMGAGKNFKVSAPDQGPVQTDDCVDALANCAYQLETMHSQDIAVEFDDIDLSKPYSSSGQSICEYCEEFFDSENEVIEHQKECLKDIE